MSKSLSRLAIFPVLAALLAPGALAQDDEATEFSAVSEKAQELLDTLGDYSADQRDEAVAATAAALEDVDQQIEALEQKMHDQWDTMDAAARDNARESMQRLRQERTELAEWYGGMKNSSAGAWDEVKEGFSSAYESLGEAWHDARGEFEQE